MRKKLLSLVILLCFSLNSFASTNGVKVLERILNDYQYTITVDWDQKDQIFYERETQKFFTQMKDVIEKDGLTQEEVLSLVEKKLIDKKAAEALKLKFSLISNINSSEELGRALQSETKSMYAKGASWNGEVVIITGIIVVAFAVLAYQWWFDATHKCVQWEEKYDCSSSSSDDRSCWTEVDEDGSTYEDCDEYWNQDVTQTCGPMNSCVKYEKTK
jgi:hypothetical protein